MIFLWGRQPAYDSVGGQKASAYGKSRLGLRAARGEHTPLIPS